MKDDIMCFVRHQLAYIEALNDTFADMMLRNTASKGIICTFINYLPVRMIPLNSAKNVYFTSACDIVYNDSVLRQHVFETNVADYTLDPCLGIRFNERLYNKIPWLENILPMRRSHLVDLVNLCYADIDEGMMQRIGSRACVSSRDQLEYAKDCLVCVDNPDDMYENTYSEYRDYFDYNLSFCSF